MIILVDTVWWVGVIACALVALLGCLAIAAAIAAPRTPTPDPEPEFDPFDPCVWATRPNDNVTLIIERWIDRVLGEAVTEDRTDV